MKARIFYRSRWMRRPMTFRVYERVEEQVGRPTRITTWIEIEIWKAEKKSRTIKYKIPRCVYETIR